MQLDVGLLRQYAAKGLTRREIAKAIGLSYSRTTTLLRENKINLERKQVELCDNTQRIINLRKQNMSYKEIAKIMKKNPSEIGRVCRKYGLDGIAEGHEQRPMDVEDAISIINKAGYDYISGFENAHSKVTVRCRKCGSAFEKMYRHIREKAIGTYQYDMMCPHCWRLGVEENRKRKREPKEREAHERAVKAAENRSRKISEQLARRLAIHVCKNCGTEFCMEVTGYNSEQYCSKKCQSRYFNRTKNEKRIDRLKSREHDTDITLEKLFKRDGGVCYICGNVCDWSDIAEKDGTMIAGESYPSIDHVKPVARGGTHTWDNIRLACRACNSLKGWK